MKKLFFLSLSVIALNGLVGCAPDLVVKNVDVIWDETDKKAEAIIANEGNEDAGNFMVYFNADENPESSNHRPQIRKTIPGLAKGATINLSADFEPLAHQDNYNLANVYSINVLADPKNMVQESDEENNEKAVPLPITMACVDFTPPPPVGTEYSASVGNSSGDMVMSFPNGIKMSVYDFRWNNGGTFNRAMISLPPRPLGSGLTINTNNINLEFDFTGVLFPVSKVEFDFLDMGGIENFSVNGQPVPIYVGEFTSLPASLSGIDITVTFASVTGGKAGSVILTGRVQKLKIGGQELWLDNICSFK